MPSLIDIRRRVRSVKNTQQITKAMKMVAAARIKKVETRMKAARPFAYKMQEEAFGGLSHNTRQRLEAIGANPIWVYVVVFDGKSVVVRMR